MGNFIRLFKLVDQYHKGFVRKSIIFSILTGILPIFNVIAPKLIIEEFQSQGRFEIMFFIALLALVSAFFTKILSSYANHYYERILDIFEDELAYKINEKILHLPVELTDTKSIQDKAEQALIAARSTYSLLQFMAFVSGALATGIFSMIILVRLNIFIPVFLVGLALLNKPFTNIIKENEKIYQENSASETRIYQYYFRFAKDYKYSKDIKIYNAEDMIIEKSSQHMNHLFEVNHRYFTKNGALLGVINVINNLGIVGSFSYICYRLLLNTVSLANFTLYFNCLNRLIDAIQSFQQYYSQLARLNISLNALYDFLDIKDKSIDTELIKDIDLSEIKIEFKHVYFKYPTSKDYILEDCSFVINPGETVALVGRNGAGKSTIVKLLCKFYKPTSGEILLNGINISDIDTKYYYQILSPTFQDFMLFPFRIDENVASLKADDIDDDSYKDMEKSFKLLNIDKWIDSLPKGKANYITTLFDKEGVQPSGGLGQKLALARSMHHKGKFIIMDEPTSALDPRSEQEIFENMLSITKDQTSLFISHRLSSTKYADRILVCNHGRIDEEGTHEDLLKENKLYKQMFTTQAELYA